MKKIVFLLMMTCFSANMAQAQFVWAEQEAISGDQTIKVLYKNEVYNLKVPARLRVYNPWGQLGFYLTSHGHAMSMCAPYIGELAEDFEVIYRNYFSKEVFKAKMPKSTKGNIVSVYGDCNAETEEFETEIRIEAETNSLVVEKIKP